MKPYLFDISEPEKPGSNSLWIDLEHVLAITSLRRFSINPKGSRGDYDYNIEGFLAFSLILAFRKPLELEQHSKGIQLSPEGKWEQASDYKGQGKTDHHIERMISFESEYEKLLQAWLHRDQVRYSSQT